MSFRSRARRLQRKTGLSYQKALERIRAQSEAAERLARERGWPIGRADLELAGVRPIEVIEVPEEPPDPLQLVLDRLLAQSGAKSVFLTDREHIFLAAPRPSLERGVTLFGTTLRPGGSPHTPLSIDESLSVHRARVEKANADLLVYFDDTTSLGLVRLRTAAAVEELDRIFALRRAGGLPPLPGSSGPSGLPGETGLSVVALRRRKKDR